MFLIRCDNTVIFLVLFEVEFGWMIINYDSMGFLLYVQQWKDIVTTIMKFQKHRLAQHLTYCRPTCNCRKLAVVKFFSKKTVGRHIFIYCVTDSSTWCQLFIVLHSELSSQCCGCSNHAQCGRLTDCNLNV